MKMFELPCYDSRKSFYNKATVIEINNNIYLKSYDTIVCMIDSKGLFHRLWDGYSATTQRHINSFIKHFDLTLATGVAAWRSLPVERCNLLYDKITDFNNKYKTA